MRTPIENVREPKGRCLKYCITYLILELPISVLIFISYTSEEQNEYYEMEKDHTKLFLVVSLFKIVSGIILIISEKKPRLRIFKNFRLMLISWIISLSCLSIGVIIWAGRNIHEGKAPTTGPMGIRISLEIALYLPYIFLGITFIQYFSYLIPFLRLWTYETKVSQCENAVRKMLRDKQLAKQKKQE